MLCSLLVDILVDDEDLDDDDLFLDHPTKTIIFPLV